MEQQRPGISFLDIRLFDGGVVRIVRRVEGVPEVEPRVRNPYRSLVNRLWRYFFVILENQRSFDVGARLM